MKHFYLLLFFLTSFFMTAQSDCDTASGYLVNAYSHVKDSYESNNISHLKYYANRSLESFKLSKKNLASCGCAKALDIANKSVDLLAQVELAETYEDGRFYVKRAKEMAKESIVELDKFTASAHKNEQLTALEQEQQQLKEQQLALKQKEQEIKQKLAAQKLKSLELEKEKLIDDYESIIASNIETFNNSLQVCNCNHKLLTNGKRNDDTESKNIIEIKKYYINNLKSLTTTYLKRLGDCEKM